MAALVISDRPLAAVLDLCQRIEAEAGRQRDVELRWGPRVLDLDILVAAGVVRRGARLTVPHPRLATRAFALLPAARLAPDWTHPLLGRTLAELAATVDGDDQGVVELGPL